MERLQKIIANAGVTSRRKAEEYIQKGLVKVNGKVVTELGFKASPEDVIEVNGQEIQKEEKVYFLFYKPKKTICSLSDEKDRKTIMEYFKDIPQRIFPVGRLDYDTTGLLIMTNDGDFANVMMHPSGEIDKTYHVIVKGYFTEGMAKRLEKGIKLEDGVTAPSEVEIVTASKNKNRSELYITIHEGKNREVRRMMEFFDMEVTKLTRISYGGLTLGKLQPGQYRKLRSYEIKKLMSKASR